MSILAAARLGLVAAVAAGATLVLVRAARATGHTDAARGAEAARKRQRRPVPCVGGAALLVALACAPGWPWDPAGCAPLVRLWPEPPWVLASLLACFAVGAWDDRRPLGPLAKAALSLAAFGPVVLGLLRAAPLAESAPTALAWALGGCAALHVLNTYDNADGALGGLAFLGFLPVQPFVSAACAGFLPLNLDAGRAANRAARAPTAYLGDGGSFVLGFLVAATPQAWGLLWLPALDLCRLSFVRLAGGSRPWIGDRRHLAHRLEARGSGPVAVALVLAAVAAPSALGVPLALRHARADGLALALAATALAFLAALRWSRERAC